MHTLNSRLLAVGFMAGFTANVIAAEDPRTSSWLVNSTGATARIFQSTEALVTGQTSTTWSRGVGAQSTPIQAGVGTVSFSEKWVYIHTSGLGYHTMGPWYLDVAKTKDFPNFPSDTQTVHRIPRTPVVSEKKTLTHGGPIGYFVDGVAMFDYTDTFSYNHASGTDGNRMQGGPGGPGGGNGARKAGPPPGGGPGGPGGRGPRVTGDGIWNRDAYVNEGATFDPAFAHQAGNQYHYHANAPALRYQLGDHVDYQAATRTYTESTAPVTQHSPILGWADDGFPVYGPYGYANATDPTSGLRRMTSGYVIRDGTNGTANLATVGRVTLPSWAALAQSRSAKLSSKETGPAVGDKYILGYFLEDYDYLGDLGKKQGIDFDLDQYNGRFAVTPEFPAGTYAYFISIEADGTPKYPYVLGRWFYGQPTGSSVRQINETVTAATPAGNVVARPAP